MRFFRLLKVIFIFKRYGLFDIFKLNEATAKYALLLNLVLFWIPSKHPKQALEVRCKQALERLGPIYIKFGQLLSTRPDLLPKNYLLELSKLQSQVKAFDTQTSLDIISNALKKPIDEVFSEFQNKPIAAASIAQVHRGRLRSNNQEVAIKVRRPHIKKIINKDIALLKACAWIAEKLLADGKRLRPQEIIEEFEMSINGELEFLQEAANCNELARLHKNDKKVIIPEVYYDYCTNDVIVMQWMNGIPISEIDTLRANHIDLVKLSHYGVEIFYTQVFDFGFFHADMHPGNILCSLDNRYIALDFGIIGCLSEDDKRYLAINILAFFNRDYKKVAQTHVESGWAPADTPIEQFENAIRAVCEPIFNKPLAQISFAQVLIGLFQVSRRFGIIVQPQLILLQKTIVNVEGLGRLLNPELDLWATAKPILNRWIREQMGIKGFLKNIQSELPYWSFTLPTLPREFSNTLQQIQKNEQLNNSYLTLAKSYRRQNYMLIAIITILLTILILSKIL